MKNKLIKFMTKYAKPMIFIYYLVAVAQKILAFFLIRNMI